MRKQHDHGEFSDFGWLEVDKPERQPSLHPVLCGNEQHQNQQKHWEMAQAEKFDVLLTNNDVSLVTEEIIGIIDKFNVK